MLYGRPLTVGALLCIVGITTFAVSGRDKPATAPAVPKAEAAVVMQTSTPVTKLTDAIAPAKFEHAHMPPRRVPIELAGTY